MHTGNGLFAREVPEEELKKIVIPGPGEWVDRLYCHDARDMRNSGQQHRPGGHITPV